MFLKTWEFDWRGGGGGGVIYPRFAQTWKCHEKQENRLHSDIWMDDSYNEE